MKWCHLKWYAAAVVLLFGPVGLRMLSWERTRLQAVDREMAKSGEELFNHTWQIKDALSPDGDGLGPVFNARSCVACHNQGGPGGGGDVEHNVTTYVIQVGGQKGDPVEQREGVIHTHATEEQYRETLAHLDPVLPPISQVSLQFLQQVDKEPGGRLVMRSGMLRGAVPSHIQLSQRNTPALFGSNLIDSIPERVILANERAQRVQNGKGTMGRVHRLPDGRVGRFGWKGQTAHLAEFVQAACANELGLGNPGKEQPVSLADPNYRPGGLDLTQQQCDQLTAFVASLKRPEERLPAETGLRFQAQSGKALFSAIGCADCHQPNLGSVEGIYSDLLLHRMGESLVGAGRGYNAEPAPAKTEPTRPPESGPLAEEWRTPPLWGVADSAPYLHDGRAATLEAAIELHDGQAAAAAEHFRSLEPVRRTQLLAFLRTLRAP